MKEHKVSDNEDVICTTNGWLEDQPSTTILLQRNQSYGEMQDIVRFSYRRIC